MTEGAKLPPWASYALRYGGTVAAVLVVWFTVALPLRDDFRTFTATVDNRLSAIDTRVAGVSGDVRNLTENVIAISRERLARIEERLTTAERELAALRTKVDGK